MSQQTNAGFNAPGFSVVSDDPVGLGPRTVSAKQMPFGRTRVSLCSLLQFWSLAVGVGHIAGEAGVELVVAVGGAEAVAAVASARIGASIIGSVLPFGFAAHFAWNSGVADSLRQSRAAGVGHKPKSVASMGRVDGTSRDNDRPAGVADAFQVSSDSVEPVLANRCRNLFSHEDSGPSGTGESKQVGPQMPIVSLGFAFACDRERLARRGACPDFAIIGPPGEAGGKRPSTNAGEEMALPESDKVIRSNIDN